MKSWHELAYIWCGLEVGSKMDLCSLQIKLLNRYSMWHHKKTLPLLP